MLSALGSSQHGEVLVGLEAPDDAAVYALDGEQALVSTLDFFTPIVDDAWAFGAIAAANALSDIYAMGGRPLFGLNIVAFPIEVLDHSVLAEILRGGQEKAAEAGAVIVGGHSIDDAEPKFGMVVVGIVERQRLYRLGDGRAGDRIVLGKAIGTGVISTAIKRGAAPAEVVSAAVESMLRLNREAMEAVADHDSGAMTDVTGFGLLGHLSNLARASGLSATIEAAAVPLLPGALELAEAGCVPGGTRRNQSFVNPVVSWPADLNDAMRVLLCDAQTSGGLLMSVAAGDSASLVKRMRSAGYEAAEIGTLTSGTGGEIEVR